MAEYFLRGAELGSNIITRGEAMKVARRQLAMQEQELAERRREMALRRQQMDREFEFRKEQADRNFMLQERQISQADRRLEQTDRQIAQGDTRLALDTINTESNLINQAFNMRVGAENLQLRRDELEEAKAEREAIRQAQDAAVRQDLMLQGQAAEALQRFMEGTSGASNPTDQLTALTTWVDPVTGKNLYSMAATNKYLDEAIGNYTSTIGRASAAWENTNSAIMAREDSKLEAALGVARKLNELDETEPGLAADARRRLGMARAEEPEDPAELARRREQEASILLEEVKKNPALWNAVQSGQLTISPNGITIQQPRQTGTGNSLADLLRARAGLEEDPAAGVTGRPTQPAPAPRRATPGAALNLGDREVSAESINDYVQRRLQSPR